MLKKPIDLPPIISIELIQISDITNIPYAPKARKILEKIKKEKEKERIVSEQAPPKVVKKEKPDAIPLPEDAKKQKKIETKKQNPKECSNNQIFEPLKHLLHLALNQMLWDFLSDFERVYHF